MILKLLTTLQSDLNLIMPSIILKGAFRYLNYSGLLIIQFDSYKVYFNNVNIKIL